MAETRKLAAILAADVAGYSRLAGADEDRTLARLRALRSDLIDPTVTVHHGRIVKRTGDGSLVEFRSVVDAVRCAIEVQSGMIERNAGLPPERRIEFRVGIHLGDVVEESDGDLMGDGINIAARLEGIAKPGSICLSEDAYRQVKARLDLAVSDLGEQQLKNIAQPIRAYSLQVGVPAETKRAASRAQTAAPSSAPRLSIVVLPFANIGGDPEQEYFVDGVTESLTTDLCRISGAAVIARNTAFTYKGKHVDVKQVGRDLSVRYVVEGSVQRGNNRLRVNVQLIDTATGIHLWAERFDKPVADLFDMQDEIVARLANTLNAELIAIEARRAEQAPDPDSLDLYFQGMAWVNRGVNPEYFAKGRACFERALELDPFNVEALVGQARIDSEMVGGGLADDRAARLASAEAALSKALALAPNHPWAHTWMGLVNIHTNHGSQAITEAERALALDRNLAHAQAGVLAGAKIVVGRAEESEGHVQEGIRLSPRDSNLHVWAMLGGVAKLCLGDDEAAVTWLRRSTEANRNFPLPQFLLANALEHLGQKEAARSAAAAGLALDPAFTVRRVRMMFTSLSDNPVYRAQVERVFDGMADAGVPPG
jgi:TolB-like protein/class 3 adenylate cyclase/Flp pilus assembly protein TadD